MAPCLADDWLRGEERSVKLTWKGREGPTGGRVIRTFLEKSKNKMLIGKEEVFQDCHHHSAFPLNLTCVIYSFIQCIHV